LKTAKFEGLMPCGSAWNGGSSSEIPPTVPLVTVATNRPGLAKTSEERAASMPANRISLPNKVKDGTVELLNSPSEFASATESSDVPPAVPSVIHKF